MISGGIFGFCGVWGVALGVGLGWEFDLSGWVGGLFGWVGVWWMDLCWWC